MAFCAAVAAQDMVPTGGFVVDRDSREAVIEFWEDVYLASEGFADHFTGEVDVEGGILGEGGEVFEQDVLRRVNYYRAMAGLSADVELRSDTAVFLGADDEYYAGQETTRGEAVRAAVLMFSANNSLSHEPGPHWDHFSAQGWNGASYSNIALGYWGVDAIDAYVEDEGEGVEGVGHRRWILFPLLRELATGDVPQSYGEYEYPAANALYVMGDFQEVEEVDFVAWPAGGYFPDLISPSRWSLSYAGADFSKAEVKVLDDFGVEVELKVVSQTVGESRWGDASIVWEMDEEVLAGEEDRSFYVEVSGIGGGGPESYRYEVILVNPVR